eukprot:g17597.t1
MARALCVGLGLWAASGLEVHPERAALLSELQQAPGLTWTPGIVERFAAEKPGSSRIYGVKGNVSEAIQSAIQRGEIERVLFVDDATLPDNFDSAEQWPECSKIINDIRDQSNCGSEVDVAGETVWMHEMLRRYHEEAKQKGLLLVNACAQVCAIDDVNCYLLAKHLGPLKQFREYGGTTGGTFLSGATNMEGMTEERLRVQNDPYSLGGQRAGGAREVDLDCSAAAQDWRDQ